MIDRPEPVELLTAMASTLSDQVVPACEGAPQHAARVVANLCRILAREFELGAQNRDLSASQLQDLLGTDETGLASLVAQLDAALDAPDGVSDPSDDHAVFDLLAASVERRLAIAKPEYR